MKRKILFEMFFSTVPKHTHLTRDITLDVWKMGKLWVQRNRWGELYIAHELDSMSSGRSLCIFKMISAVKCGPWLETPLVASPSWEAAKRSRVPLIARSFRCSLGREREKSLNRSVKVEHEKILFRYFFFALTRTWKMISITPRVYTIHPWESEKRFCAKKNEKKERHIVYESDEAESPCMTWNVEKLYSLAAHSRKTASFRLIFTLLY